MKITFTHGEDWNIWVIVNRKTGGCMAAGKSAYRTEGTAKWALSYWSNRLKRNREDYVIIELTGEDMLQLLRRKSAPTLDELCASINDENRHEGIDFGEPVGEEIW
ncbi:hypothetical protein ABNB59_17155 [Paenibacillus larvae]|uniref:Uncharacterized protein n=2 Tax=root TaxID=1 RepID=A0A0N9S804_9CAUD|nr:hypothetical protein [Paenibacillus larvae]YP_009210597.1 hypothetical protein TRIPP_77 [Paenibacillus phage Tripp]ALH46450.1 hypothetical protein TRIPP_77 [Paenibacillus phage Tripp]AQR77207.1 hypothetical protein BXP28_07370 [Paenibacillus larvae subsp. larvae]AVF21837.1 Antitoxin MazE [Paenibacillus larvae subsp. larvae]ETK27468.1 hypothetical protein ERIC1_1c09130 [Paenibacillus larvae subsp. larvae DSM 25719]MCY7489812.1 hypothetical protein [Paenibacillus larvae]